MKWGLCFIILFSLGSLFAGCKRSNEFVVFSDPWCGEFAEAVIEEYQKTYPEANVNFKVRSSEVIAQRISFGEPIDYVFALDSTLFTSRDVVSYLAFSMKLAPVRLVKVKRKGKLNSGIPGAGGTMLEASDRPTRRIAERWFSREPGMEPTDSVVIANFYAQARDYLVNGWVRYGFAPDVLVRRYPGELEGVADGPEIPGGFHTYTNWREADVNSPRLDDFLKTEKCKGLLAAYKIIE